MNRLLVCCGPKYLVPWIIGCVTQDEKLAAAHGVILPKQWHREIFPGLMFLDKRLCPEPEVFARDLRSAEQAGECKTVILIHQGMSVAQNPVTRWIKECVNRSENLALDVFYGLGSLVDNWEFEWTVQALSGRHSHNPYHLEDWGLANPEKVSIGLADLVRDPLVRKFQAFYAPNQKERCLEVVRKFTAWLGFPAQADACSPEPPLLDKPLRRDVIMFMHQVNALLYRFLPDHTLWRTEPGLVAAGQDEQMLSRLDLVEEMFQYKNPFSKSWAKSLGVLDQYLLNQSTLPHAEEWTEFAWTGQAQAQSILDSLTPGFRDYLRGILRETDPRSLTPGQKFCLGGLLPACAKNDFAVQAPNPNGQAAILVSEPAPLVSVLTPTYNHAAFIQANIESVLAQKCDFPVRHIIADDCSTDGTAEIIQSFADRYPSIVPILHRRNTGGDWNHRVLMETAGADFVALCDGDDYFISSDKLQTQVDFMNQHPDCALCFHPVLMVYEDRKYKDGVFPNPKQFPRGIKQFYYLSELIRWNFIQTNSVLYRWRWKDGLPYWFRTDLLPSDWYWHLVHAEQGKIGFIPVIMSAYRRHQASVYYTVVEDRVAHRAKTGLRELRTMQAMDRHFGHKYEKLFSEQAVSVFYDLSVHAERSNDDTLFVQAIKGYPKFARFFSAAVQKAKQEMAEDEAKKGGATSRPT